LARVEDRPPGDGLACALLDDMGTGFEQLIVWQRARRFCGAILPVVKSARTAHDFELSQQLNSAALSIMSNIAEGHLRRGRRQFAHFLAISAGSNGEARSCLFLALDRSYVDESTFRALLADSEAMGRMLEALRASVLRQKELDPP
jgi:four helix bundle protein